ncbi:hypothetical protein R6Q57_028216 [Mikania cordata]
MSHEIPTEFDDGNQHNNGYDENDEVGDDLDHDCVSDMGYSLVKAVYVLKVTMVLLGEIRDGQTGFFLEPNRFKGRTGSGSRDIQLKYTH